MLRWGSDIPFTNHIDVMCGLFPESLDFSFQFRVFTVQPISFVLEPEDVSIARPAFFLGTFSIFLRTLRMVMRGRLVTPEPLRHFSDPIVQYFDMPDSGAGCFPYAFHGIYSKAVIAHFR